MRMSQVLNSLAEEPGERISISTIFGTLSDQSFAILVVLLGLPNCLPMPPPLPAISALLLILVAVQIAVQRPVPWLPRSLMRKSIRQADLGRAIRRALPIVSRLETWSRPRLLLFDARTGAMLSGMLLIVMAVGLLTAAPLIGQVPYGIAVCLIGLGRAEGDGLLVLSGLVVGVIGAALSASFLYAIFLAVRGLFM